MLYICIMKYDFDEIIPRHHSGCLKYDGYEPIYGASDLLPMWVADMDFRTPEVVLNAIRNRLEHPILGYFEHSDGFYESIIGWMAKRHHWEIQKEWIVFSPGIVTGLSALVAAFTSENDRVLVQTPVYHPFFYAVQNQNRTLVENPLKVENGAYEIDFPDLEKKLKAGVKMMIISNPHNPVGRCWTPQELTKMADLCLKYKTLLVSDEIHADLMMRGSQHTVTANLSPEIAANTITCMSPSKTFNLAGLSTSEIIIPDLTLRKQFVQLMNKKWHIASGNIFGDVALEAAYTLGEEWLEQLLDYLTNNVDYCKEFFKTRLPKTETYRHEATYLLWVDFSGYGLSHSELSRKLIQEAKLAFNDGAIFGTGGEQHFRINLACPKTTVVEAMNRLYSIFKS